MVSRPQNSSPLRRRVGLAIRRERESQRLTLDQLAARCGCARSTLQRWEAGRAGLDSLERVSRALRLPLRRLVEGGDGE